MAHSPKPQRSLNAGPAPVRVPGTGQGGETVRISLDPLKVSQGKLRDEFAFVPTSRLLPGQVIKNGLKSHWTRYQEARVPTPVLGPGEGFFTCGGAAELTRIGRGLQGGMCAPCQGGGTWGISSREAARKCGSQA